MVQWKKNEAPEAITASLEFDTSSGGLELIRPVINTAQKLLGMRSNLREQRWQQQIRYYDLNSTGILGHSLDIIAFTAGTAQLRYVDPMTYQEIDNHVLQSMVFRPKWRDDKDIFEAIFAAVRYIVSVGEFDLVLIDGEYDIFSTAQRHKTNKKTVQYRQRNSDTEDLIEVPIDDIERCFVSQPGANHEAYAATRRILPELQLYDQITRQFINIAYSNSLMTKLLYLGIDDGEWQANEEYMSQFSANPSRATPPSVNDFVDLALSIANGDTLAPWYPTMGEQPPVAIDLTTSFDDGAREMRKDCNIAIAEGLNIPARLITGDNINHFTEWLQDEQFRSQGVIPALKVVLKFFDKYIYSAYSRKYNYDAKLWFSYDHVAKTTLNPAQFIELAEARIIGLSEVRRQLGIREDAKPHTREDEEFAELMERRNMRGGRGQEYGQNLNAVPDSAPITNGQKRQSNVGKEEKKVTSSIKKKI